MTHAALDNFPPTREAYGVTCDKCGFFTTVYTDVPTTDRSPVLSGVCDMSPDGQAPGQYPAICGGKLDYTRLI